MLCIIYVLGLSTALGVVASLLEGVLPARVPRRWVWLGCIAASLVLPAVYQSRHTWTVTSAPAVQPAAATTTSALEPATPLHRDWWARTRSWDAALEPVWLAASAVVLLWILVGMGRIRVLTPRKGQREMLLDGVPVVITDSLGPATVGIVSPRIVIPRWVLALPAWQRRYVIGHEEEHRRARDTCVLFVASLPLILLPWNIALWWQIRRLQAAVEMDCDARVLASLGDRNRYGELLLRIAEAGSRGPRFQAAFLGGRGTLERRIRLLLSPSPVGAFAVAAAVITAILLLALAVSAPHPVLGPETTRPSAVSGVTVPVRPSGHGSPHGKPGDT